jgi:hypothetical protein
MNVLKNTIEIALTAAKGPMAVAAVQVKKVPKAAPPKKKKSSKKSA